MKRITLKESVEGRLECAEGGGGGPVVVRVFPCFPLSHPGRFLSLVEEESESELALIESPGDLDDESRRVLESHLRDRSFMMVITAIHSVEEEPSLREWNVETRQGPRRFLTRLDAWPRKLDTGAVVIQDISDDLYLVKELADLDQRSQGILWSYMD